jgi:hypothetical protein
MPGSPGLAGVLGLRLTGVGPTIPMCDDQKDGPVRARGKRNIAMDAMDLLLAVVITAASVQDHDAARPLLWNLHRACRRTRLILSRSKIGFCCWSAVLSWRQAARLYSLIRPFSTGFRRIRWTSRFAAVTRGTSRSQPGTRWSMP